MKTKEKLIDLSDIKDDELDKTAAFTDLMSRSERKRREKEKKKEKEKEKKNNELDKVVVDENNNITMKDEIENISDVESIEEALSETKKYEELTQTLSKDIKIDNSKDVDETDDDFDIDDKKFGSGLLIVNILFLLLSLGLVIYLVIFTSHLNRRRFLYIDFGLLTGMFFLFGISLMGGKKLCKFFTILNIVSFIGFIIFNGLLFLNYIK